jgi:hypothetical protein
LLLIQVLRRVEVPAYTLPTGNTLPLAFDEIPEIEDTTYEHQSRNAFIMREYSRIQFPDTYSNPLPEPTQFRKTYPNLILVVASWDTIREDAHNDPQHFTSPIGKTIFSLKASELVDLECTNVIVVVTKALSSWHDYDDYDEYDEKRRRWVDDVRQKTGIIGALQRKTVTPSRSWRVVFIENGGGRALPEKYRVLPNGELSHQNLFEAIRDLFVAADSENRYYDLVGLQALGLLTGAPGVRSRIEPRITWELEASKTQSEMVGNCI